MSRGDAEYPSPAARHGRPSVSVVVPARNDAAALPIAVDSVMAQEGAGITEVVIAVASSVDDTARVAAELAAQIPAVRVVHNPAGTTPAALNTAIAASTGEIVVRVDARSVLPPDYLANALDTLDATGAANVGAVQNPVGHTARQRGIAAAMRSVLGSGGAAYRGSQLRQRVDTAYLGVFRRVALDDVGGFDERFVRNQDAELNLRLNRAGHEVWLDPRLVVDYEPRPGFGALARQYWQYGWWRRRTAQAHRRSLRLRQLASPVIVVALATSAPIAVWWTPIALVVPLAYGAAVAGGSIAAPGLAPREWLACAAALVVMHLSWGSGFIASALRSLVAPDRSARSASISSGPGRTPGSGRRARDSP